MTITSMYDKWPDFHEKEWALPNNARTFERLLDKTGTPPPVIDSDDLLETLPISLKNGVVRWACPLLKRL